MRNFFGIAVDNLLVKPKLSVNVLLPRRSWSAGREALEISGRPNLEAVVVVAIQISHHRSFTGGTVITISRLLQLGVRDSRSCCLLPPVLVRLLQALQPCSVLRTSSAGIRFSNCAGHSSSAIHVLQICLDRLLHLRCPAGIRQRAQESRKEEI